MANTDNLDLKRLDGPKTTKFDYDIYVENNFEKIDAAIGAPPENLTTVSKTIVPAINELDDTKVDKIEGKQLSTEDYSSDEKQKLAGIEPGATADMTAEEIKVAYESNSDTNAYTNSEKAKVSNIPENTNLDLSDKAQKLKATNLVTNGDFVSDLSNWTYFNTKATWVDGRAYLNRPVGMGVVTLQQNNLQISSGDKIYVRVDIDTIKSASGAYGILNNGGSPMYLFDFSNMPVGKKTLTEVFNITSWASLYFNTIENTEYYVDKISIINLTATFGAGNEPSKEQMERLLSEFPNSWFDGTQEILPLKVIPQLLDEKANKAQEPWQIATLQNGWTGTLKFRKNSIGEIEVYGISLICGTNTINTVIASFPMSYRPIGTMVPYMFYDGSTGGVVHAMLRNSGSFILGPGFVAGRTYQLAQNTSIEV